MSGIGGRVTRHIRRREREARLDRLAASTLAQYVRGARVVVTSDIRDAYVLGDYPRVYVDRPTLTLETERALWAYALRASLRPEPSAFRTLTGF